MEYQSTWNSFIKKTLPVISASNLLSKNGVIWIPNWKGIQEIIDDDESSIRKKFVVELAEPGLSHLISSISSPLSPLLCLISSPLSHLFSSVSSPLSHLFSSVSSPLSLLFSSVSSLLLCLFSSPLSHLLCLISSPLSHLLCLFSSPLSLLFSSVSSPLSHQVIILWSLPQKPNRLSSRRNVANL